MGLLYITTTVKQAHVCGFQCNKCKDIYTEPFGWEEIQEKVVIKNTGGYASVWGDGNIYEIVLCQNCAYELLSPYATFFNGGE